MTPVIPRSLRSGLVALLLASATSASAQDAAERAAAEQSDVRATGDQVANRRTAAQAYDRAANYFMGGQFDRAGQWFMTAYRLAPARAALVQAVRSYQRAGELARAGTLAILLAEQYPNDAPAVQLANEVMVEASRRAVLVTVECDGCEVEADGRLLATQAAYLGPDEAHAIVAYFGNARVEREARGESGAQVLLEIETPEGAEVAPDESEAQARATARRRREEEEDEGGIQVLGPGLFWTSAAATVGLGALTLWSGLDTLSGVDAYEATPTLERLQNGQDKERRTNLLIGFTAAFAATTAVLAIFTDFAGDDEDEDDDAGTRAAIVPTRDGAVVMVEGQL
ncbi:MAG: hypothetical protein CMN29_15420 [Sandaracinus sp.]|nr:hypothetical protein [Sandaracinus sp.]